MPNETANPKNPHLKPFAIGNPGRPKGSRNRLSEAFVSALHDDFKEHGARAIEEVRTDDPASYLRVIASIVPKQVEIKEGAFDGVDDEQLAAIVAAARSALGVGDGGREGVGDAESSEPASGLPALH
jgi:hypothetical protein